MGDRGNIVVIDNEQKVFLYAHWKGCDLPDIAQRALNRGRGRWNDPAYLTRIIFCDMIGNDLKGESGYGISPFIQDNEYPLLVVNCDKQEVYAEAIGRFEIRGEGKSYSFEDFSKLQDASWRHLDTGR